MLSIGDTVKVHYTGEFADGKVFDTTVTSEPIMFTLGDEMMIEGFEKAVLQMSEGESKKVLIKAAEAYGEYDKDLLTEVNKKEFLGDKVVKVGDSIQAPTDDGVLVFNVNEIKGDTIVLDGNSNLAGKDVYFTIQVLEVYKPEVITEDFEDEFGSFEDELGSSEFKDDEFESEDYLDAEDY